MLSLSEKEYATALFQQIQVMFQARNSLRSTDACNIVPNSCTETIMQIATCQNGAQRRAKVRFGITVIRALCGYCGWKKEVSLDDATLLS